MPPRSALIRQPAALSVPYSAASAITWLGVGLGLGLGLGLEASAITSGQKEKTVLALRRALTWLGLG